MPPRFDSPLETASNRTPAGEAAPKPPAAELMGELSFESHAVTFPDVPRLLRECAQEIFRPPDARDLPTLFDQLRSRLNVKGDYLTRHDVDKAIGNPEIKGAEAQALVALKQHFDRISALHNDGKRTGGRITKADVATATADAEVTASMTNTRQAVAGAKRSLYADNDKPLESINSKCVVQAGLGNCYFYAALASLAECDPRAVDKLIKQEKDGRFTVSFPGAKPITVHGPTDAEIALFPKPMDQGSWVHVLEKAYGEYCMNDSLYRAYRSLRFMGDSVIPQDHTDGGSMTDSGLKILTNDSIGWQWSFKGPHLMHQALVDARARRVPITADTGLSQRVEGGPQVRHVYSVLDYDARKHVLTLRNPWADTVPKVKGVKDLGKGVFEMEMDSFCAYFTKISYTR